MGGERNNQPEVKSQLNALEQGCLDLAVKVTDLLSLPVDAFVTVALDEKSQPTEVLTRPLLINFGRAAQDIFELAVSDIIPIELRFSDETADISQVDYVHLFLDLAKPIQKRIDEGAQKEYEWIAGDLRFMEDMYQLIGDEIFNVDEIIKDIIPDIHEGIQGVEWDSLMSFDEQGNERFNPELSDETRGVIKKRAILFKAWSTYHEQGDVSVLMGRFHGMEGMYGEGVMADWDIESNSPKYRRFLEEKEMWWLYHFIIPVKRALEADRRVRKTVSPGSNITTTLKLTDCWHKMIQNEPFNRYAERITKQQLMVRKDTGEPVIVTRTKKITKKGPGRYSTD